MGRRGRSDTGLFFIPFSAAMLVAGFGALAAGWTTPWRYRRLLCVLSVGILVLVVLTVLAFWPMNAALCYHGMASPKDRISDAQSVAMAARWVQLAWVRGGGATAAFVAALRALTLPWPAETAPPDPPIVRLLLVVALAGVAGFVIWFVSNI